VIHRVRLVGRGRATVAAYGLADAEHRVEKEIRSRWAECSVQIAEIRRDPGTPRIAEEFEIDYRVACEVEVEATTLTDARRDAFRRARERFEGSPYWRIAWEDRGVEDTGQEGAAG
jgi:hypothetical protein